MEHLAFLYYLLSFTIGCVSIGISLLVYSQHGKKVIRLYSLFLGSLALIQASLTVLLYGRLTGLEDSRLLLGLAHGTVACCLILVAVSFGRLGNRTLKDALKVFFFISLAFFPLIVLEVLRERFPVLADYDYFELLALPSYFFVINALSIVLSIRYFNQPPYLAGSELTDYFKHCFGITAREAEIVSLLAGGRSYNEIAAALFISYKTVDNHIRSIYQKTAVKNRVQLLNLLQANRKP